MTAVTEQVQTNLSATDQRVTELETAYAQLKQELTRKVDENARVFKAC
ncbi:cell division protein FtsB [Enterobacter sp. A4]